MNHEVDAYVEGRKLLPSRKIELYDKNNTYYHFKTDIFKKEITYSTDRNIPANLVSITSKRAFDIINMNKNGEKPFSLLNDSEVKEEKRDSKDILGDNISRFDKFKKKKNKKNDRRNNG